jgi:hypothetical protein
LVVQHVAHGSGWFDQIPYAEFVPLILLHKLSLLGSQ